MNFYLIGVDYKSATLEIRQRLYRKRSQIEIFFKRFAIDAAALVTCNRFDINFAVQSKENIDAVLTLFRKEFPEFYAHSYVKETGQEVLRYGLRLACGLESQLKGEFQILEQLQGWLKLSSFPKSLFEFWSQIIQLGIKIRIKSGLYSHEINIAQLLFEDLKNLNSNKEKLELAVIGTGKVAGLIAEYRSSSVSISFLSHKNRPKAESLANRIGAQVFSFDQLKQLIPSVDVLVSAASCAHVILTSNDIGNSVLYRNKPLYIYDLGFPLNVEMQLKTRENVILKNIDDLIVTMKNKEDYYCGNLNLAEYLIEEAVKEKYAESWHAAKSVSD